MRHTPTRTSLVVLGSAAFLVASLAPSSAADDPRGPRFGNATISSAIRHQFGEIDEDVFVEPLIAGETLRVKVSAPKGSALLPTLTVSGPDGLPRDAGLRVKKGGRLIQTARIAIDATGLWTVTIAGADATSEGAYQARFAVGKARPQSWKRVAVGGDAGVSIQQPFHGVEGARATVSVKSTGRGATASFLRVLDPGGASVSGSEVGIRTKKRAASIAKLPLADGHGAYSVLLSSPGGAASVNVTVKLRPPSDRPRGKVTISSDEPYLTPADDPIEGFAGKALGFAGANLSGSPLPEVWFGALRGSVVNANAGGTQINVVPPQAPYGSVVDVTVVAADGQAAHRPSHFTYLEPEDDGTPPPPGLALAGLTPGQIALDGGATQAFEVSLSQPAPAGGVFVNLLATGGVGVLPPTVRVATGATKASFLFRAQNVDAAGVVQAAYGTTTVSSDVTVTKGVIIEPPPGDDTEDLSGWSLAQANSARTFVFPQGTVVAEGGYVIVARNCSKAAFESFWGVTLGTDVVFLSSADSQSTEVPTVNGSESYSLSDAFGETQDGPTVAMASSARQSLRRIAGQPAGSLGSWTIGASSAADPGSGISEQATGNGVYVSEFSDAAGAGNFIYEFVEVRFD